MSNYYFSKSDHEAIEKLDRFLPNNIFDAHMHLSLSSFAPGVGDGRRKNSTYESYIRDMKPFFGNNRNIKMNVIIEPDISYKNDKIRFKSVLFLDETLNKHRDCVGEIVVMPNDTKEDIEKLLINDRIVGFKCYHFLSNKNNTWNLDIGEYLPESAWEVANKRHMCITLHMVKDDALADMDNMSYIQKHAKRYPNAKLILAHAGRSFASWTGVENVDKLINYKNVLFDLSAICEPTIIIQLLKTVGSKRCMWGSDYSCCMLRGKAVSLGNSFYWIYDDDIKKFSGKTRIDSWLIGTENLTAIRQACVVADLSKQEINDLFYNVANRALNTRTF